MDTSFYPTSFPQPQNPLETFGKVQELKNSMLHNQLMQQELQVQQQHLQQQQIETQVAQGTQRIGQYITDHTDPTGRTDWLGVLSASAKDPLTAHPVNFARVQSLVNDQLSSTSAGVQQRGGQYVPVSKSRQAVNEQMAGQGQDQDPVQPQQQQPQEQIAPQAQPQQQPPQAQPQSGEMFTAPPMGYDANQRALQDHYQQTLSGADSAMTERAALKNVYDLSRSGAPSGQVLGSFYTYLAQHNLAPAGAKSDAEMLQLIRDHSAQIATASMPPSDAKLFEQKLANVNSEDLPETLQKMIPYLIGTRDAKIAQAQYYRAQDPSGTDPNKISNARSFWQQHADPRLWELQELRRSDPAAFKERIKSLGSGKDGEAAELKKHADAFKGTPFLGQ